jgi:hypothetical protein
MAKKKQQKKTAKKASRAQPRAKKKAPAKKSLGKKVKARPAAEKATPKKISMPPVARTAFLTEATPSGTPIGLERATQIVKTCAMGADLGSTIGDLPDPGGFGICIGNQTSGCNCPNIPLSSDTKLLAVVAAVAQCTCG